MLPERNHRPALAMTLRQYLFTNHVDSRIADHRQDLWAPTQVDFTASLLRWGHLFYGGVTQYMDWSYPEPLLTPFAGVTRGAEESGLFATTELRLFAINQPHETTNVSWIGINDHGAVGLIFGLGYHFASGASQ